MTREAAVSNFKCFHECSNVTAANIVGHLSSETRNCCCKFDKTDKILQRKTELNFYHVKQNILDTSDEAHGLSG